MKALVFFATAVLLAGAASVQSGGGAHEIADIKKGDTLTAKFTVLTDTVLRVKQSYIIAQRCGKSRVFLRLYQGNLAIVADTVEVRVCPEQWVESLHVATRFDSLGHIVVEDATRPIPPGQKRCVYVMAFNWKQQYITGIHPKVTISDTAVFKYEEGNPVCPDTTIIPRLIPYPTPIPPASD